MLPPAVEIQTEYIIVILAAFLPASLAFLAWIVREMGKQQIITAAQGVQINAQHETILSQQTAIMTQNAMIQAQQLVVTDMNVRLRVVEDKVSKRDVG